jgi:hypothetical protein
MPESETMMVPPFETLSGQQLDPAVREKLLEEIQNGEIVLGGTRVSISSVRDNRRLMAAVSETIIRLKEEGCLDQLAAPVSVDRWPEQFLPIETIVRTFVPLAYQLGPINDDEEPTVRIDEDWAINPNFVSAFKLSLWRENSEFVSVNTTLVKGCLQPLCITAESLQRKELMQLYERGIPLPGNEGYQAGRLMGKLVIDDLVAADGLSLDGQLAMLMLLAADQGVAAFLSTDGTWPDYPPVTAVAQRLGVKMVKFDFGNIPEDVIDRLPYVQHVNYSLE